MTFPVSPVAGNKFPHISRQHCGFAFMTVFNKRFLLIFAKKDDRKTVILFSVYFQREQSRSV